MSIFKFKNTRYAIQNTNRGFTFVELIVVIAIFSIMAGVVIFNARDFGDGIALQNLAQDIAMQLKKAQNDGSSGKFNSSYINYPMSKISYGLNFNLSNDTQFNYFTDLDNHGTLNNINLCGQVYYECIKTFSMPNGNKISKLCINQKSGNSPSCNQQLDITFTRPNLNAQISVRSLTRVTDAEIEIMSPKGKTKTIVIWPTGQISIE